MGFWTRFGLGIPHWHPDPELLNSSVLTEKEVLHEFIFGVIAPSSSLCMLIKYIDKETRYLHSPVVTKIVTLCVHQVDRNGRRACQIN